MSGSDKVRSVALPEESAREREIRLILAASRGVFVALTVPALPLGDACRRYNYGARTFEGDAFETAFLWAHEEVATREAIRESEEQARG